MRFLKTVYHIGFPAEMSPEDAKYSGMSNLGAFMLILINPPYILYCYLNNWPMVMYAVVLFMGLLSVTFAFNKFRRHLAAIIWFGSVINIYLVFLSVVFGWEVVIHYLIFFTAGGSIMLFRRNESRLMVMAVISTGVLYCFAYFLSTIIDPVYILSNRQLALINSILEFSFFAMIIINAIIARYGAIAAEDQLKAEMAKSKRLLRKIQELDHQKTIFFQNISHELRTPLTLIIGPIENALCGKFGLVEKSFKKQLEMVMRNARQLLRLINQLLDISKFDAGRMRLRARKGDLVRAVKHIAAPFEAYAEKADISLTINAGSEKVEIYHDPEMLVKVVYNLMSNAIKFTPKKGHIRVSVSETKDGMWGKISVKDTGIGISQKDLPHIFDRFKQVDGTSTREHEGTGIGLSLVKEIVRLHGGKIFAKSVLNAGTEMIVLLPLGASHLGEGDVLEGQPEYDCFSEDYGNQTGEFVFSLPGDSASDSEQVASPPAAPTILIVEDNADMRRYIRDIIRKDYHVVEASNGKEGLEKIREDMPDLVISDVMMPKLDGHQLLEQIKQSDEIKHIPVILLTARASEKMTIEGIETGAHDYLTKPFSQNVLLAKIKSIIERQTEQAAMSLKDSLTGLRNRKGWEQEAFREMENCVRSGKPSGLAFIDLDNFKRINDSYGHPEGDLVLMKFASILSSHIRSGDLIGRYGGEEFVIYFPGINAEMAAVIMNRALENFRSTPIGNRKLSCSFSAGVVTIVPDRAQKLADYISMADSAMYEAKKQGKGKVLIREKNRLNTRELFN